MFLVPCDFNLGSTHNIPSCADTAHCSSLYTASSDSVERENRNLSNHLVPLKKSWINHNFFVSPSSQMPNGDISGSTLFQGYLEDQTRQCVKDTVLSTITLLLFRALRSIIRQFVQQMVWENRTVTFPLVINLMFLIQQSGDKYQVEKSKMKLEMKLTAG